MGRIGPWEIVIIVVLVLLFFGPKKLPEFGAAIGEFFKRFKKASREAEEEFKKAVEDRPHDQKS